MIFFKNFLIILFPPKNIKEEKNEKGKKIQDVVFCLKEKKDRRESNETKAKRPKPCKMHLILLLVPCVHTPACEYVIHTHR